MADTTTTATTPQPPNRPVTTKVTTSTSSPADNNNTPQPIANAIAPRKWSPPQRNTPTLSTEQLCTALSTLKPPGSPNPPTSTTTTTTTFAPKTTCKCTKIGLMQLFHEMKQEFATVPDYLVHQYVTDNCHNRPALLDTLKLESQRFPGSVQAYPQALRNQSTPTNHICNNNNNNNNIITQANAATTQRLTKPQSATDPASNTNHSPPLSNANQSKLVSRPSAMANPNSPTTKPPPHAHTSAPSVPGRRSGVRHNHFLQSPTMQPPPTPTTSNANNHLNTINNNKNNNQTTNNEFDPATDTTATNTPNDDDVNLSSRLNSDNPSETTQSDTSRTTQSGDHPLPTIDNNHLPTKPKVPQRPSTLNLPSSSLAPTPPFHLVATAAPPTTTLIQQHRPQFTSTGQPTRAAPPPPRHTGHSHQPIDSPLNVSVNVTVSPAAAAAGSDQSPARNVRHTSAITVHPEIWPFPATTQPPPPIVGAPGVSTPMRSFTSVQFKLRPPVAQTSETSFTSPQPSPIDISAGPSLLTYSSASFDARIGMQSHLQITVDGGGNGTISATRTRPRHFYTTPSDAETNTTSSAGGPSSMPTVRTQTGGGGRRPGQLDEAEVVHRQILCKRRLALELDNDRRRLARIQHEINTLSAPMPAGGSNQLVADIQRLQHSCKQMVQMVEEAGPYVLGETDEEVIQHILSSQTLPRHQRPPRPPPPQSSGATTPATPNTFAISPSSVAAAPANTAYPGFHQLPNYLNNQSPAQPPQLHPHPHHHHHHHHHQQQPQEPQQLQPWSCNMCTFQNHPLMNKCEQCEMPLLTTSGTVPTQTAPYSSVAPTQSLTPRTAQSLTPLNAAAANATSNATPASSGTMFIAPSLTGPPSVHFVPHLRPAPPPPYQSYTPNSNAPHDHRRDPPYPT